MRLPDFVRSHVRSIARTRRPQRLPWPVVRIRLQVLDLVLVHHPHQVSFEPRRLVIPSHLRCFPIACG